MGPIICATDYSKNSVAALKFGYALSKKLGTRLIALHVFDINVALVTPLSMTFAKIQKEAFEKQYQKLSKYCEVHLGLLPDDTQLSVVVKENAILEEELIQNIHDFDAELLLMGMKGTSAIKDAFFGSSTKRMIDTSPSPIIAVPPFLENHELDTISYATDFEESDIHALKWVINTLATPLKSLVTIVHIATKEGSDEKDQMEWFKEILTQKVVYDNICYDFIEHDDMFKGLMDYLDEMESNLVVMLEREHSGFIKSLTYVDRVKMMSSKGEIPLVSLNKKYLK